MAQKKSVFSNFTWLFCAEVISRIGTFFLFVYMARKLGDSLIGMYSFAISLSMFVYLLVDFGIFTYLIKEISKNGEGNTESYHTLSYAKLILNIFGLLCIIIFSLFVSTSLTERLVVILGGIALFISYFGYLFKNALTALEDMKHIAIAIIIERFFAIALTLFFLSKGFGLVMAMASLIVSYLAFVIYIAYHSQKKIGFGLQKTKIIPTIKLAFPHWFSSFFFIFFTRIDTILLPFFTSFAETGWYSAAARILEGLTFIPVIVVSIIFPVLNRMFHNNKQYLHPVFKKAFYYTLMFLLPLSLGGFFLSEDIILFFYGESYSMAIFLFKILSLSFLFFSLNFLLGFFLNSINKQKVYITANFCAAILLVILDVIFMPMYGANGAALISFIIQMILCIILIIVCHHEKYSVFFNKKYVSCFFAAVLMALFLAYFKGHHLFFLLFFSSLVYCLGIFLFKGYYPEDVASFFGKEK